MLIYDLKDFSLRHKIRPTDFGGYTKLVFSIIDPQLFYAASTLGDLFMIDCRNGEIVKTFKGHAAPINDFVEIEKTGCIATAGDDNQCMVFSLDI